MKIKKKTYNLDKTKIEKVRRLFGLKTETQAIQWALDKLLMEAHVENTLKDFLKKGKL